MEDVDTLLLTKTSPFQSRLSLHLKRKALLKYFRSWVPCIHRILHYWDMKLSSSLLIKIRHILPGGRVSIKMAFIFQDSHSLTLTEVKFGMHPAPGTKRVSTAIPHHQANHQTCKIRPSKSDDECFLRRLFLWLSLSH